MRGASVIEDDLRLGTPLREEAGQRDEAIRRG